MIGLGHYWGAIVARGVKPGSGLFYNVLRSRPRSSTVDAAILVVSLICSAGLMAVAAGTGDYPLVGWVGLLPLFLVIRMFAPFRAMLCGALWGFCLYLFSASNDPAGLSLTNNSLVFLVLIGAVYAGLGAGLTRGVGYGPLFLAFGWVGLEFALRLFGLSHGLLATTQGGGGIIQVLGGSLGYFFVVFLIAFANAEFLVIANGIRFKIDGMQLPTPTDEVHLWPLPNVLLVHSFLLCSYPRSRAPPRL